MMTNIVHQTAKKTFLNLDDKRQKEILDIALLEFLMHDYQNASFSQIIKNSGLAKGSFYRYFNSKKDLYIYLLYYTTNYRFDEIDTLTADKSLSLEEIIIENFRMKIEFDKRYPLFSGFTYRVLRETNKEVEHIKTELWKSILDIIQKILFQWLKQNPEINVNVQVASYSILQMQLAIFEYLEIFHQVDFIENIKNRKPVFTIDNNLLMEIVRDFTTIVLHGIINKKHND